MQEEKIIDRCHSYESIEQYLLISNMKNICRIVKVSRPTLTKWLKKALATPELADTLLFVERNDVLELGRLLNAVRLHVGCGLCDAVEFDRWLLISSVIAVRKVIKHFGRLFLRVTNMLTATVIFGMSTKTYFLKTRIVALEETLGKPIISNDAITSFDNGCLAIPIKPCLFQSPITTMLKNFSLNNIYSFRFLKSCFFYVQLRLI
jgi:hypothetical protein